MEGGQLIKVQPSRDPWKNDQDDTRDGEAIEETAKVTSGKLEEFATNELPRDQAVKAAVIQFIKNYLEQTK